MATFTILGAGAMGSALGTPLSDAGHEVRLWGTWLDDHLVAALRAGRPHPRTDVALAAGVQVFDQHELADALTGADYVVVAVASGGVEPVVRVAAALLGDQVRAIGVVSKGFAPDELGRIQLLPQTISRVLGEFGHGELPVVAVGGPCKANEVAARQPTAAVWAIDRGAESWVERVATPRYRPRASSDRDGVEICAALKNVYAIALGVADGMTESSPVPYHDLKSAIFAQALAELRLVLTAEPDADPWTALGLAGAGDLEVTGLSGRNKVFGSRLGRGQDAPTAIAEMAALEQTVEGVAAVELVMTWLAQRHPGLVDELPLLVAINTVVHHGAPVSEVITAGLP